MSESNVWESYLENIGKDSYLGTNRSILTVTNSASVDEIFGKTLIK